MAGLHFEPFPDIGTRALSSTDAGLGLGFMAICSGEVLSQMPGRLITRVMLAAGAAAAVTVCATTIPVAGQAAAYRAPRTARMAGRI